MVEIDIEAFEEAKFDVVMQMAVTSLKDRDTKSGLRLREEEK